MTVFRTHLEGYSFHGSTPTYTKHVPHARVVGGVNRFLPKVPNMGLGKPAGVRMCTCVSSSCTVFKHTLIQGLPNWAYKGYSKGSPYLMCWVSGGQFPFGEAAVVEIQHPAPDSEATDSHSEGQHSYHYPSMMKPLLSLHVQHCRWSAFFQVLKRVLQHCINVSTHYTMTSALYI